ACRKRPGVAARRKGNGLPPTTTTTAPSSPTWAGKTAFPRPAFTPSKTVDVYSQSAFSAAWSSIQPGEQIDVHGVTFTGEVVLAHKQLSSWAEVHFDAATRFVGYGSASALPAVWINKDAYIRFYGGDISDSASGGKAGTGIDLYDSSHVSWWDFDVHDVGGSGIFVTGITQPVRYVDLRGEVSHWGENLAWDPHAEKGTGLHGILVADSNYGVEDSRFAIHAYDGAAGAGMEIGGSKPTDGAWRNTIYMWCQNLTMRATSQVAGNCVQVWGYNNVGNDFAYVEAENLQGRAYDAGGVYGSQSLSTDTVGYGRASQTNLNPYLARTESSIPAGTVWDTRHATQFGDVASRP
ncbi:MAG TPA: hypothetical protein VE088_01480, partial [Gaiellaceae bacterium]|nr:hypothetical protein [Gaiellaceae bacterium]